MVASVLAGLIIVAAIAYAGWGIVKVSKNADNRCYGCPIKDACDKKSKKNHTLSKKSGCKFGNTNKK